MGKGDGMTSRHVSPWRVFLAAFGVLCALLVSEAFFGVLAGWVLAECGVDGVTLTVLSATAGLLATAAVVTVACE